MAPEVLEEKTPEVHFMEITQTRDLQFLLVQPRLEPEKKIVIWKRSKIFLNLNIFLQNAFRRRTISRNRSTFAMDSSH
jgi:hypothetical protein